MSGSIAAVEAPTTCCIVCNHVVSRVAPGHQAKSAAVCVCVCVMSVCVCVMRCVCVCDECDVCVCVCDECDVCVCV